MSAAKSKTSHELGIYSETIAPPADITTDELLAIVEELNRRPEIDGILVQMPLPAAGRFQARSARRFARKGCRRFSSLQCRQPRHRSARAAFLHARRHH